MKKALLFFLITALVSAMSSAGPSASSGQGRGHTVSAASPATPGSMLTFDVSHLGGAGSEAVLVEGNYAYLGIGSDFTILDISNPSHPVRVGTLTVSETYKLTDMAKRGPHVFVVGWDGLHIIDVADVTWPILLISYQIVGYGNALSVALSGNYAYLGYGSGLRVLDISNPAKPEEIGVYSDLMGVQDIAVAGSYAYLALATGGYGDGLAILDISNPATPALVTLPQLQLPASGLAISGSYAYLAQGGLRIFDISNPFLPVEVGFCDCAGGDWTISVVLQDQYAYISNYSNGMLVVDVSDPAQPAQAGLYDPEPYQLFEVRDVFVVGDRAFIGFSYPAGMEIVDISSPANPARVGDYLVPGASWDVAVAHQNVYIADEVGLHVLDRSDPAHPAPVGYSATGGNRMGIEVAGDFAYLAIEQDGLRIFDLSDPAQPEQIGYYYNPDSTRNVAVARIYAYLPDTWGGVRIIDITHPITPTLSGFVDLGVASTPSDVAVAGNYAYITLTGLNGGLRIVDISNPGSPRVVGVGPILEPVHGVVVQGRYAYLAVHYTPGLRIWDISNPSLPVLMGNGDTPSQVHSVDVTGRYAYLTDEGGLSIFDVADPAHPERIGYFETIGNAYGVGVDENYLYVGSDNGVYILRTLTENITTGISPAGGSFSSAAGDVQLIFPSGAFTQTAEVTYKRLLVDQDTAGLVGAGATFETTAIYSGTHRLAALAPGETFTVTVHYTATQLGPIIEDTLALYYWDGAGNEHRGQWVRDPSSSLDTSSHTLTAASDRLTLWAVLGETRRSYLPAVLH